MSSRDLQVHGGEGQVSKQGWGGMESPAFTGRPLLIGSQPERWFEHELAMGQVLTSRDMDDQIACAFRLPQLTGLLAKFRGTATERMLSERQTVDS